MIRQGGQPRREIDPDEKRPLGPNSAGPRAARTARTAQIAGGGLARAPSVAAHPRLGGEDGLGPGRPRGRLPVRHVALGRRRVQHPLLDHLGRLADVGGTADHSVAQRLVENHGVVEQRVVRLLLAELVNMIRRLSCRAGPGRRRRTCGTRRDSPAVSGAASEGSGSSP